MKIFDILYLSALNIWRRKLRTILTVVGVIIGTTCIVLMFAIGASGYEQYVNMIFGGTSFTKIYVSAGSGGAGAGPGTAQKLNDSAVNALKSFADVKAVTPVIDIPCIITIEQEEYDFYIRAIDTSAMASALNLKYGELPGNGSSGTEIVIGRSYISYLAEDMDDFYNDPEEWEKQLDEKSKEMIGTELTLRLGSTYETEPDENKASSRSYRGKIAAVIDSDNDSSAYITLEAAQKILQENRSIAAELNLSAAEYNQVIIWAENAGQVEGIITELEQQGFTAYSPVQDLDSITAEQKRQQTQLVLLGLVTLLVSAIGIANTMLTSIWERRSEIGICKVIGMSAGSIRLQFLIESALIGLTGGLIGVIVSFIAAIFMNSSESGGTAVSAKISISPLFALAAIGFAVAVGVISGIYPAWKATKLRPLEVMRGG